MIIYFLIESSNDCGKVETSIQKNKNNLNIKYVNILMQTLLI